jgi:hypothetical protein
MPPALRLVFILRLFLRGINFRENSNFADYLAFQYGLRKIKTKMRRELPHRKKARCA